MSPLNINQILDLCNMWAVGSGIGSCGLRSNAAHFKKGAVSSAMTQLTLNAIALGPDIICLRNG